MTNIPPENDDECSIEHSNINETPSIVSRKLRRGRVLSVIGGWLACSLTTFYWISSNSKHSATIERQEGRITVLHEELQAAYQKNRKLRKTAHLTEQKITKTEKLHQQAVAKLEKQKEDTKVTRDLLIKHLRAQIQKELDELATIQSSIETQLDEPTRKLALSNVERIKASTTSRPTSLFKAEHKAIHSKLAEIYSTLGDFTQCKEQLVLADGYDPKLTKSLTSRMDLEHSMNRVNTAITDKKNQEAEAAISDVYKIIETMKEDPNKSDLVESLTKRLLTAQGHILLNEKPAAALPKFLKHVEHLRKLAKADDAPVSIKESYMNTCIDASLLCQAAGDKKKAAELNTEAREAAIMLETASPDSKDSVIAKSRLLLIQADNLFSEGNATAINKLLDQLKIDIVEADEDTKKIVTAAALGHKACLQYDKGLSTSARENIKLAVDSAKDVYDKDPNNIFVQYRYSILLWQHANLSRKKDDNLKLLNQSADVLHTALKQSTHYREYFFRELLAMIEGDLGHLAVQSNKNDTAKKHITNALKQWESINEQWGKSEEREEVIKWCKSNLQRL